MDGSRCATWNGSDLRSGPRLGQAWVASSYPAASMAKRQARLQTDINDCSQWATTQTGFNPGSNKLPSWDKPRPPSNSAQAHYNHWMGSCLGQRESQAN